MRHTRQQVGVLVLVALEELGGQPRGLVTQPPVVLERRAAQPLADHARKHGGHQLVERGLEVDRQRSEHGLQQAHEPIEHGQAAQVAVDLVRVRVRVRVRVWVSVRVSVRARVSSALPT